MKHFPPRLSLATYFAIFVLTVSLSVYNIQRHPFMYDDSFIGFRIAKNFAAGSGLVYNAGERVMTSTTILYALSNGLLWSALGDKAITIILLLNAIWHALTACLLFYLVHRTLTFERVESSAGIAWVASLFASLFFVSSFSVGLIATCGMETPFYTLFICIPFFFYIRDKLNFAVAFSVLPFLIRPEGFLVAFVIMSSILLTKRKVYVAHICIIAAIVVPYLVILYLYYGTVIPQSIAAKRLIHIDRLEVIRDFLNSYFLAPKRIPIGLLFLSGIYYSIRINRQLLPFAVWALSYGAFFTLTASWWAWYKPPFYMAYSSIVALGIYFWANVFTEKFNHSALWVACTALLTVTLAGFGLVDQSRRFRELSPGFQAVAKATQQVAGVIAQNSGKDQTVMLEPLGLIGFYALERKFIDFPGLCSPRVTSTLKKLGRGVGRNFSDYGALQILSADIKPFLLVLRESEYPIDQRAGVINDYKLVGQIPVKDSPELYYCILSRVNNH